ncbi:MAG TPA: glycosyltransferase family 39 protein [Polyangiaceae bacterium]|nr:glycosyltransferase family 39 protein [Polyangiaceae bacterium]
MTQSQAPGAAFGRYEWLFIAVGALAAFWLHWHFRISGFGEQDAGRLASDAINWHFQGSIDMTKVDYRLHTSPLYIHSLKLALDHGLSVRSLPALMNGLSVFASSACMVGLYLLFRQLSTPAIAAAATIVYSLTPCFWLGSVYGMPTLPALTLLVFSALAFGKAADQTRLRSLRFAAFIALSALLAALAFSTKADMALSSGALLLALIARGRLRPSLLACIVLIVGLGTLFTMAYARHVALPVVEAAPKNTHAVGGFLESWNGRFPFKWSLLIDPKNNAPITHAAGTLLFAVCVLALLQGVLGNKRRRWLTFGAAAWGLAPMLFWGLKPGNSARHNLPAYPPLVFLAVLMLFRLVDYRARRAWILIVMLFALGQMDMTGNNSVNPRVDVLLAGEQVEKATGSLHARAREFMNSPNPKKAIIETEYLESYSEFEAWAAAKAPALRDRRESQKTIADGPERETRVLRTGSAKVAKARAQSLREQGFDVFSLQFSL